MGYMPWIHQCRLIAITGGPASGKAELLLALRQRLPSDVAVLPDSGAMLHARTPAQGALPAVWRQVFRHETGLEGAALDDGRYGVVLCQHGTPDCLQSWPGDEAAFWREMGTTREQQYRRYEAVIHLRPPSTREGGTEVAVLAHRALEQFWAGHPRRYVVDWSADLNHRLSLVEAYLSARRMDEQRRAG